MTKKNTVFCSRVLEQFSLSNNSVSSLIAFRVLCCDCLRSELLSAVDGMSEEPSQICEPELRRADLGRCIAITLDCTVVHVALFDESQALIGENQAHLPTDMDSSSSSSVEEEEVSVSQQSTPSRTRKLRVCFDDSGRRALAEEAVAIQCYAGGCEYFLLSCRIPFRNNCVR